MLKQCHKCVHYVFAGKSLNYDLSRCNMFNTFAYLARLDNKQCGKTARKFKGIQMSLTNTTIRED